MNLNKMKLKDKQSYKYDEGITRFIYHFDEKFVNYHIVYLEKFGNFKTLLEI